MQELNTIENDNVMFGVDKLAGLSGEETIESDGDLDW